MVIMEKDNSLVKETLLENVTLRDIIKSINLGLLQYSFEGNLRIVNPKKPGFVVILSNFPIAESIIDTIKTESKFPMFNQEIEDIRKLEIEVETSDFIVLTLEKQQDNKQRIITIPLLELLIASESLIADDSGKHKLDNSIDNESISWNLDSTGWYCYDIHN